MNNFKKSLKVEPKPDNKKEQAEKLDKLRQFEELMRKWNEEAWEK